MKRKDLVKETNVGIHVELTNVELTLIKTKWLKICQGLSEMKNLKEPLVVDISHFTNLMEKLCGEVWSLDQTAENLFSSEPISEDEMKSIIDASAPDAHDIDFEDEERAERAMKYKDRTTDA